MNTFVPRGTKRTKLQIEQDANTFLQNHFPEHLTDPGKLDVLEMWELLADVYNLRPGVAELSDGVEGMAWPDGRVEVSEETFRGAAAGRGRPRFTMCHEAYHGLQHCKQIRSVLSDTGELVLYKRTLVSPMFDPEWQANQFAAMLLMPSRPMQDVLAEAGRNRVADVVYYFGVTQTAAKLRIKSIAAKFEPAFVLTKRVQKTFPFISGY